jgi:FecR-like protein
MKKLGLLVVFLLAPSVLWAQGVMTVSNVSGVVEIRSAASKAFVPMSAAVRQVNAGDQIRTGDGSYVMLTLADGSYLNVTPNSTVTIQDYWSSGLRGIANILAGKVRFYIEKLGGQPNPVRVGTPTALIAVRGTIFDVAMDQATQYTEVTCLDGRVGVSTVGLEDREVVLDPGFKTLVAAGQAPLRPIAQNDAFPNRQFRVVQASPADMEKILKGMNLPTSLARDNDRGARPQPGVNGSSPTAVDPTVSRAKPGAFSYPQ